MSAECDIIIIVVRLHVKRTFRRFWNMKSENCPEVRREIAEKSRRGDNKVDLTERKEKKFTPKLFTESGRPYSLNLARLDFTFQDEVDRYELDLHVYK